MSCGICRSSRQQSARDGKASEMSGAAKPKEGRHDVTAQGLLHRHHALHRLQSLRGRVQAVESVARRRLSLHRHVLRQHRGAGRVHVAACRVHRAAGGPLDADQDAGAFLVAVFTPTCASTARAPDVWRVVRPGAIIRTEFDSVYVQPDICNGCGYCVVNCPFGVIDRREDDGRAWKCTLCYDRLREDMEPACAKACPTESIQFGDLDELREQRPQSAWTKLHDARHQGGLSLRRGRRRASRAPKD